MTSGIRLCPKCGAEIPAPNALGEGGCPGCLLETGLGLLERPSVAAGDGGGSVENVETSDANTAPNTERAPRPAKTLTDFGDYELLEEIGRGGQGVVFRARQKSLNRTVAVKVISLGQWASKTHLKRFRLEAEAAARLEHPGIVPIHEVGERDGSCYFSMKFVEGGQLDEVVRRAPMSIRQAVELIVKVARTVHYAHEHDILHRDIKPGNILLDAKGEPHLTDFGLARLVETESTVTRTLEVLGTPSYMAPEQAVGNNAAISSVTDVYGLGAVLYQLLTGQPPFAGGTTYETIKLLLDTEPRQPRLLNPKIDRDLSTICLTCLEKDPKRRYSSALALAEDLERWLKHEPIRARRTGVFARGRKWVLRNPTTAFFTVLSLVLAAGSGWIAWKSELIRQPLTTGIAVLPFENLSPDPENAYFADGMQEEILTRLASIADLKVISRTSTQQYQSKPRNLREIAKQLGVANILEGSVQKAADQVRVNVQLVNAQTDSHLWAETFDRKLTDIFSVESEIAKGIAESLQARLTGREQQALAVKPTNNPEAYDAYLRGLAFDARAYVASEGDFIPLMLKAADSYERAVQLDPNFALAWGRLSRLDANLYVQRVDINTRAGRDGAAKLALEKSQTLEPSSPETLLALGYYQYWVLGDRGLAKTTFGRVSKMLPGSSEVPHALALVNRREGGHWNESIAYFKQALALDPRNVELVWEAAQTYVMVRRFPDALKLFDRLLDMTPNDLEAVSYKVWIYQAQGNLQEAARLLSGVNEQTPNMSLFQTKINQLRFQRNYGEGLRLSQAKLAHFRYDSDYQKAFGQLFIADGQRLAGDTAGAKVTAESALNTLEKVSRARSDDAQFWEALSAAYRLTGQKDSALKAAERAVMLVPSAKDAVSGPNYEYELASMQAYLGENSPAISTLARLLQTPYGNFPITRVILRLDPRWDPLRADPTFQKLCEEKQP